MNERDKTQVRLLIGLGALVLTLHYPKAAAVVAGGAVLLVGGTIWGVRSALG